ncbi:polyprotein [Fusarium concentricum hypovirus 1]|nr:polyprotein [Fusarium concentricum hypovirus 1]
MPEVQTLFWFLQRNPSWVNDTPFWVEERDSGDYHLVSGLDAPHCWTQLLELVPTGCRVGGNPKNIPSKLTFANFDEAAWVGDAVLALSVRVSCLKKFGKIDGHWYQKHTSNEAMLKFLSKTALGDELEKQGLSTWHQGQVFEFLFATERQFRAQVLHEWKLEDPTNHFVVAVPLEDSTPNIGAVTGEKAKWVGFCWRKLFKEPPMLDQPWLGQPFLSKAQLLELARSNPWSEAKFGLQKDGNFWHVVDGNMSPVELVNSMFNKTRLGGAKQARFPVRPRSGSFSSAPRTRHQVNRRRAVSEGGVPADSGFCHPLEAVPLLERECLRNQTPLTEELLFKFLSACWTCSHSKVAARFTFPDGFCYCSQGTEPLAVFLGLEQPTPKLYKTYWGDYIADKEMADLTFALQANRMIDRFDFFEKEERDELCWHSLFPQLRGMKLTFEDILCGFECEEGFEGGDFSYLDIRFVEEADVFHVENFTKERVSETQLSFSEVLEWADDLLDSQPHLADKYVELTTAVVLGTIGDVEPTLDVVAANHFSALTQTEDPATWKEDFRFTEKGYGWCASDFLEVAPDFARALDDKVGAAKGTLEVTDALWNRICTLWGGELKLFEEDVVVGGFPQELEDAWFAVPERPLGAHHRVLPEDLVLLTHPDHIEKLKKDCPEMMNGVETRVISMPSKPFIKLGQDILEGGFSSFTQMKEMQATLTLALKETMPIVEQSDLVYLVSGTTFHYFIGSLFPDKQVFEVCPVPREDNGVCPEFYLGHYAEFFSKDPHFGHQLGRLYSQWLTTPLYLKTLEWEGEYKYSEPPKFHSVMPWAQQEWKIESPNVGFKPYADFIKKDKYVERETIRAYFSLGSCAKLTKHTYHVLDWLNSLKVDWTVDARWAHLFPGKDVAIAPFFDHATGLCEYDWAVHHGGSGVTNTCLAIGLPQTILPQIGDQFIWADKLAKHLVPTNIEEAVLRAHLFHTRLPAKSIQDWNWVPPEHRETVKENGGRPVQPYYIGLHCCHDTNEYGLKIPDLVIAETDNFYFTLFDQGLQRTGIPGKEICLKWIYKKCDIWAPPIAGWRGVCISATYPWHAHGWLGHSVEREGFDSSLDVPREWLLWLANQSLTAKDKRLKRRSRRPLMGDCKRCGRHREIQMLHCMKCIGDIVSECVVSGEIPDLPPVLGWSGNRLKGPDKSKAVGLQLSGSAIRSTRRYFQVDTRALDRAPKRQVARAILDKITSWDDIEWVEAYWFYTNTKPPHYNYKTHPPSQVEQMARLHADVTVAGIAQDIVESLGKVLSISKPTSLARRLVGLNILTPVGRGLMKKKWHVLVDALRHYDAFAKSFNITAMPEIVKDYFPEMENIECTSYVHFNKGICSPIQDRSGSKAWIETLQASGAPLKIHMFSLRLPALGSKFGVFHSIVEYKGKFYELQQVAGNYTHINISKWLPEATPDRPLVKTIVIEGVEGDIPDRLISREFSGNDYKVLGDNCLVFANFIVYLLTGKVVHWRHFGAFGQDLSLELGSTICKWVTSFIWTDVQEKRLSIAGLRFEFDYKNIHQTFAKTPSWTGPKRKVKDYGLHALRSVDAAIASYEKEGGDDSPWSNDAVLDLAFHGYKEFGLTAHVVSRALMKLRMSKIPLRKRRWNLMVHLLATFRKIPSTRLAGDVLDFRDSVANIRSPLRASKKPAWAPLLRLSVPRHWFREKDRLIVTKHDPENLTIQAKKVIKLDLPQIAAKYGHYFDKAQVPKMGFKFIKPGEYEVGVKVPNRKSMPKMDAFTWSLVTELQQMYPFELGVFSLQFGTDAMAEKITDRYFTGSFAPGTLITEEDQQAIANAIFENNLSRFANAQLINPEEVWRKWHKNYSAGFPFRFNEKGNMKRQELIDLVGGKQEFIAALRKYIEGPELYPSVSHVIKKDEALPASYVDREKIRTIIAQDPLAYFAQMAVDGDVNKRTDPSSFSAVGVSPAHGEMAALAEQHLAYKHHFAMDVTALDSTAAIDATDTIKRLRKLGFQNHPQRANIETMIDGTMDNLVASWIIDIHTGRARFKKQGLSTGHASTTPDNTMYMEIMMVKAYGDITGRPYNQFYEDVKFSSFSDDNFWSTNLPKTVFSAELISEYWLKRGVQVRVEGESDNLADLSFLAKRFSFDPAHLEEVRKYAGRDARVAIVHDIERLLQKFSVYKKKNTLAYRWEKFIALQANCAHYPDVYKKVDEYIDAMEKEMRKRKFLRKFMQQHPRKSYEEIMVLMYAPGKRQDKMVLTTLDKTWQHSFLLWWDTLRVDIMAFDGTANTYARVLERFTGILEIAGLNVEDPGVFLKTTEALPVDPEFTLEHHVWLLNGCVESFEAFRALAQKTPFSAFMRLEEFWAKRDRFSVEECVANGLRAKVLALQVIYVGIAWLERALYQVPIVGSMYKMFCSAKGLSESLYSRLNSLYYAMFGDSSLVISSMMTKDRYFTMKVLAFKLWTQTTSSDIYDFDGDLDQFQSVADNAAKIAQDFHNMFFEMDFSALVPRPDTNENKNTGLETQWQALDHGDSVQACVDLLEDGKYPMVNGPTGCGKSTDFIVSLQQVYDTVIVAQPRRILVQNSPVAQRKLYSGSPDKLTAGLLNFGTSGYLRRVLGEIPDNAIIVLDEFHEMDEDSIAIRDKYLDKCITVTATPDFPNSSIFTPVTLTKSRNPGHTVTTRLLQTKAEIADVWDALNGELVEGYSEKVLIILPSLRMVQELTRHAIKLAPDKRICQLYRGKSEVYEADWYFATSVVDAGLTIPDLTCVIDSGWSLGFKNGSFTRRASSHNVSDQRRGRTGRTKSGLYIRLQDCYNDDPWDFSTPFIFNNWHSAKRWCPTLKKPLLKKNGCLQSLPPGYEDYFAHGQWSHLIYLTFLYENRGDVDKCRTAYQAARKFPDSAEVAYLVGPRQNMRFLDLHVVEAALKTHRIPGFQGNLWSWDGRKVILEEFDTPVPKHLQDYD